jgi:hypothetical protein
MIMNEEDQNKNETKQSVGDKSPVNLVVCDFAPDFRSMMVGNIKRYGIKKVEAEYLEYGFDPRFVRAMIKSIMRKEGW